MGLQTYTVELSTNNGVSFTALTNVQNITVNSGRKSQLDQISASTASFELRYPTGYVSPVAALVSGTVVRFRNTTGVVYDIFQGVISDVEVQYGIPFGGGVGQEDYVRVSCEGAFAVLGRMQGNGYAMAAGTIAQQVIDCNVQTGFNLGFSGPVGQTLAATTVNGTWGDWVNRVCQSTNSRMYDSLFFNELDIVSPFRERIGNINFSDVANDSTNQVYNKIDFDSLADNFYTQVTVTPESFGAATVTNVGAVAPFRTYQTNTLNASTAQANDYASYLLGNYGTPKFAVSSLSCMGEAQASFQLDRVGFFGIFALAVGSQTSVTFRGTTFVCIIEGTTMSASPAGSVFTYYVSGADLNAYLILDNTTFGTLDNNKLGY
jgi:hypothetical protein